MNQKEVIELAIKNGLLVEDENLPFSTRAHQRLISRLQSFAKDVLESESSEQTGENKDEAETRED